MTRRRNKTYPRMVACSMTGIVAVVKSAEEERRFYVSGMWGLAIGFAIGGAAILFALLGILP